MLKCKPVDLYTRFTDPQMETSLTTEFNSFSAFFDAASEEGSLKVKRKNKHQNELTNFSRHELLVLLTYPIGTSLIEGYDINKRD